MAIITIIVEPQRATRILFDCSNVAPDPADQRRIEQAIEHSIRLAQADEDASEMPISLAA
jgi:hypothetical protein